MLPPEAEETVGEIAADRRSGALPLAQRAVEAYEALGRTPDPSVVSALHEALRDAQPWMVAVANASLVAGELATSGHPGDLRTLRNRLGEARAAVGQVGVEGLDNAQTLLTLSYSSDVLEVLLQRRARDVEQQVYVCESRPLQEGVSLARDLRREGIEAVLIADAAGPTLVPECDAVLIGADSLLRDLHIVNKIGTLSLALACREFGVSCHPAMEVLKVEVEGNEVPLEEERRDPTELAAEVAVRNFYFERVSADLFTSFITDAGLLSAAELTRRFRSPGALLSFYGPGD